MPKRTIVHLDADAFFASVEQAAAPRLRGKPVAVGGEKRGIIASASYEARRFGIYTPMPTARARKLCPKLILLPGDFEKYEHFSRWMFSYAQDFTPEVEITSIDEGYFDLSAVPRPPLDVAQTIRAAIRQALKISVSEGIASNKLVSQVASKLSKPAAFRWVPAGGETGFLHPLPNGWLPGVGPQTAQRLNAAGLACIGQIAATSTDLLHLLVGRAAPSLKAYAEGIDERPVVPVSAPAKSYSQQKTFEADLTDEEYAEAVLRRMADELMAQVRADGKSIRTVTVKVRYNDMAEDQSGESLLEPTDLETDVYGRIHGLFTRAWKRRVSLRMVSLKFSNVYDGVFRVELPLERSAERQAAERRLAGMVDELRRRHGPYVILRGHDFRLREGPEGIEPSRVHHSEPPAAGEGPAPSEPAPHDPLSPPRGYLFSASPIQNLQSRAKVLPPPSAQRASPSPLNGERAGVRGVTDPTGSSRRERATPHPGPLLDRGGEGARAGPRPSSDDQPRSSAPDRSALNTCPREEGRREGHSGGVMVREQVRDKDYIPLNVRSHYSFLNSTLSIEAIVALAQRHGLPAIALADEGSLHGAVAFTQAATQAGIKPILGAVVTVDGHPTSLYVQNIAGYRNLCRLLSAASTRAESEDETGVEPRQARLSLSQLEGLSDGLLAVSTDTRLASLFSDRCYFAVTAPETIRRRPGRGLRPVAAMPVRYAEPADRWKFDVVQSIRTRTLLRQAHPAKTLDGEFHFRLPVEMAALFRECPELLSNSRELADRCEFVLPLGAPQFPAFQPPDGSTPHAFLRRLVLDGFRRRYPRSPIADRQSQIEQELAIIAEVGYEEYFLVVWDILQDCRRDGIDWITRGSAADSLVCYCLGISDVCPLRFDLYFRRFLNKERMKLHKLPDIDIDFPHDRKDDVIDLIFAKHGSAHAAVVGGFSTFQARSAVADVAKVLGVSEFQIRRFTEHFPWTSAAAITEALSHRQECRDLPVHEEPYRSALQMAAFLDGFPRYPKMHPCGVVLSRRPMAELTPTFQSSKGYPTTHFDMDAVEAIGLVKIDILAQGGLAAMRDVRASLARRDIAVDLRTLEPWDDPEVWEMIAGGGARAVHHIESPAMIGLCRQCNVRDIDGLIAIVSVIRPGAANEQKKLRFTRRYQGLEPTTYPHPALEPCLRSTFGLVVYEEHILQICEAFAGLPAGRADVLRRALGKMKSEVVEEIHREFVACARGRGHPEEKIAEVWDLVSGFAGYAFCKAHSTAYGVEAYQSAWLKRYYPVEFMAAVLSNGKGFYHPLVYVLECHRLGIPLLAPDVNQPGPEFTVETRKQQGEVTAEAGADSTSVSCLLPPASCSAIRVPLTRVKGLTDRTRERIVEERQRGEFASLSDFYRRVGPRPEELEALIRAGGFDGFGRTRTAQFWEAQHLEHDGAAVSAVPCSRPPSAPAREVTHVRPHPGPLHEPGSSRRQSAPSSGQKSQSRLTSAATGVQGRDAPAGSGNSHPQERENRSQLREEAGALDLFEGERGGSLSPGERARVRANVPLINLSAMHSSSRPEESRPRPRPPTPVQGWLFPSPEAVRLPDVPLREPTRHQRLEWETELFGFPVSGHPLELHDQVAWDTYCPVSKLGDHVGEQVITCGLVIEQRIHHQVTGEPMKFLTLADWTGLVETELFADTYRSYGLATVRYPVLEITATVEPFENGRGFSLRVHRAGKPRQIQ